MALMRKLLAWFGASNCDLCGQVWTADTRSAGKCPCCGYIRKA